MRNQEWRVLGLEPNTSPCICQAWNGLRTSLRRLRRFSYASRGHIAPPYMNTRQPLKQSLTASRTWETTNGECWAYNLRLPLVCCMARDGMKAYNAFGASRTQTEDTFSALA